MSDFQLREFDIERPWAGQLEAETKDGPHAICTEEQSTPPLDTPPMMSANQVSLLPPAISIVPGEDDPPGMNVWATAATLGDEYILSMGCLYLAVHAYISERRRTRAPTTLRLENLDIFTGRAHPALLSFVRNVAVYGAKPRATLPCPIRATTLLHLSG